VKKKEQEINFEEAMRKLDAIVEKLEKGNIPLEEALKQFDAGVQLVRYLNKRLDDAERKIEMLVKDKNGNVVKKAMEFEDGELKEMDSQDRMDEDDDNDDEGSQTPGLFG